MDKIKTQIFIIIALTFLSVWESHAQAVSSRLSENEELGKVQWYRDYGQAIAVAKKEKKDVVILFQEVPGCATCRNYGHNVLSHPLMVEVLENSFIPLAIFNNKGGNDKKILEKFDEPSWNNPVVRIIDPSGKNLVKRVSNDYSAITLCQRLKEALIRRNIPVPPYLDILEQELTSSTSSHIGESYFSMYCFWTGEKQLGKVDGVLDVEAGFINQKEVVKVKYDYSVVNTSRLVEYAKKQDFQPIYDVGNYRVAANDVHYYLLHSQYKYLPLSTLQKVKINSALGSNQSAVKYLSPTQKKWATSLKEDAINPPVLLHNKTIHEAWSILSRDDTYR